MLFWSLDIHPRKVTLYTIKQTSGKTPTALKLFFLLERILIISTSPFHRLCMLVQLIASLENSPARITSYPRLEEMFCLVKVRSQISWHAFDHTASKVRASNKRWQRVAVVPVKVADGGVERVRHNVAVGVHASHADSGDVGREIGEWLWF